MIIKGLEKYADRVDYSSTLSSDVQTLRSNLLYELDFAGFYLQTASTSKHLLGSEPTMEDFEYAKKKLLVDLSNHIHCMEECIYYLDVIVLKKRANEA